MNMNWTQLALDLPKYIGVAMQAVEVIKGLTGPAKEAAVVASAKTSAGDEIGQDDPVFDQLTQNYIRARVALQNYLSAKAAAAPTP